MLGMYVHTPDLAELGNFWRVRGVQEILDSEKQVKTQFAFATTAGQEDACVLLDKAKWTCLGHRYNQLHGPRFVKLWMKEFENNRTPQVPQNTGGGYLRGGGWNAVAPPHGMFSCGVWFAQPKFAVAEDKVACLLKTKWLAVWRIADNLTKADVKLLQDHDWHIIGQTALGASIWHTAEPLTSKDKHGAD